MMPVCSAMCLPSLSFSVSPAGRTWPAQQLPSSVSSAMLHRNKKLQYKTKAMLKKLNSLNIKCLPGLHNYLLEWELTLVSQLSGAVFFLTRHDSPLFIPPGTHYCLRQR